MNALVRTIARLSRPLVVAGALIAAASSGAGGFSLWPNNLPPQPSLYLIHGYLDRAPEGARVIDRIDISMDGRRRELLVARYGTPGETSLDLFLSRTMTRNYSVRGTPEQLRELAEAPAGTEIRGTFAAYTDGPPWLLISDLQFPAEEKPAS